ncbi:hypothetical protein J6590_083353 [Homalodisca vitripennis]|nr:hypothetical protein J6590_083353 [Homalodisca vitripennis]
MVLDEPVSGRPNKNFHQYCLHDPSKVLAYPHDTVFVPSTPCLLLADPPECLQSLFV